MSDYIKYMYREYLEGRTSDSILYTTPSTFVFLDVMTVSSLQISFVVSE